MSTLMASRSTRDGAAIVQDPRWARVVARDKNADDLFWYSLATTSIYCRPSRPANPKNVDFFGTTAAAAEAAGFRPCRRCNPNGLSTEAENAAIIARACRAIDEADQAPSLSEMAQAVDLSPSYFHRPFKSITGVTPKAHADARRATRVREELGRTSTVTEAIYDAGFNSNGRFYSASTDMLGMTPSRYRSGGVEEELRFAIGQCSLDAILVATSAKGVAAILIGDDPDALARDLQDRFPKAHLVGGDAEFEKLMAEVVGFVEAPHIGLALPLDVRGTAFQRRVWQALQEVPADETATYAGIAARIGAPKSVRAVAGACAANALAVAIPCHRVVRHDGALSGYRWGVERKRELLTREARA